MLLAWCAGLAGSGAAPIRLATCPSSDSPSFPSPSAWDPGTPTVPTGRESLQIPRVGGGPGCVSAVTVVTAVRPCDPCSAALGVVPGGGLLVPVAPAPSPAATHGKWPTHLGQLGIVACAFTPGTGARTHHGEEPVR